MKTPAHCSTVPLETILLEEYKDPERAEFFVKLTLEDFDKDGHLEMLLNSLGLVARAQGSIASLALKASLSRQGVHTALSGEGNPRLRTFLALLDGLGLQLSIKPKRAARPAKAKRTAKAPRNALARVA